MADLIVQHRFCSDAAFGFAARPRRACGLLMRGRLAETATRRSVALSLCRFVDTTRHHVAVCVRVSAIAAVVSHRIARVAPPSAGHVPPAPLPHCLGSRWLCCACSGSRPARRAAFFIPGRTSGEARQRCAHATVRAATTATGSGGPGKRSWRTAPKHCHAGPRRLRERAALAAAAPRAARSRPRACVTCKAPSAERRSPSETSCASARTGRRAPFGRFSAFAAHRQAGRRH